jgi:hypothetical protein
VGQMCVTLPSTAPTSIITWPRLSSSMVSRAFPMLPWIVVLLRAGLLLISQDRWWKSLADTAHLVSQVCYVEGLSPQQKLKPNKPEQHGCGWLGHLVFVEKRYFFSHFQVRCCAYRICYSCVWILLINLKCHLW